MKEVSPYFLRGNTTVLEEPTLLAESADVGQEQSGLVHYWWLLRRRQWLILACVFFTLLAAALFAFTRTPLYTAHTTLLVDRMPPQVLKSQENDAGSMFWSLLIDHAEYLKTQYEILKSRAIAAQVVRDEGLENHLLFVGHKEGRGEIGLLATLRTLAKAPFPFLAKSSPEEKTQPVNILGVNSQVVDGYLARLDIKPVRGTSLVALSFTTPDPELSTRLVNAHAHAYVRYGLDLRSRTNEEALSFLENKLLDLKARVEDSEAALNSYRRDKGIISLSDKENIVVDRLVDFNKRLTEAEAERIALEAQVQQIRTGNYDTIPAVVRSSLIQSLKVSVTRLEGEYAQLSREFKPGYSRLDNLVAQIEQAQRRLTKEIQTEVKAIESAYLTARIKEKDLRAKVTEEKKTTLNLKDSAVQYAILARDVDTNRQLYDAVLQRMKELGVAAEVRNSHVYVIDKAEQPLGPSYPNKKQVLLIGLFLGLVLGLGLVFLLDQLDNTFKGPDEVERYLRLPNLGVVPDLLKLNGRGYGYTSKPSAPGPFLLLNRDSNNNGKEMVPVPNSVSHSISQVSEAYRTIRTAIMLSRAGEPPQTILISSSTRGDGKTTMVVNIAVVFAQMGAKVLIIDGDLRRPHCHKYLGCEKGIGLAEALAGQVAIQEVIKPTSIASLFFVSAGSAVPNPAELLGSRKMFDILTSLREQYDFIFIDSSPAILVTDPILLSTMVDGVLLVVDGQNNPKKMVTEVRSRLGSARAKILGVVLNRVDLTRGHYNYYPYYYYDAYSENERDVTEEQTARVA